ncbi:bifunctional adenosylcobinamide kinase/adenosylcobinamide-phosphate guanylyltransferase [Mycobacterium sp.]|uniref:bifunctional adenosylcobinamide kinase/adenosylcobinamide-phosphate guanylyltransferase n=1 Tax=Mycobacterium sp. TaxID=1785 RepID=UPI003C73EDA9
MRTLVLGGIRSGKSRWAEAAIADAVGPGEPVRYVATGPKEDSDPSWSARIAAHRARRPAHWSTIETDDVATLLRENTTTATLIDDVGGWLASDLDRPDADELLSAISGFDAVLVLVSPEVGLTVVPATASGRRFADELGRLNQRLADICDRVVLVVAGQPVSVK